MGFVQRRRRTNIEAQLNPRIGCVDTLATRPGGMAELFDQFACGHDQSVWGSWPSGYLEVTHLGRCIRVYALAALFAFIQCADGIHLGIVEL